MIMILISDFTFTADAGSDSDGCVERDVSDPLLSPPMCTVRSSKGAFIRSKSFLHHPLVVDESGHKVANTAISV